MGNGGDIHWKNNPYGASQEVYVKLVTVDASGVEQDLLLKSQSNTGYSAGVVEVLYSHSGGKVQVWTYTSSKGWVKRGADISVTFANGNVPSTSLRTSFGVGTLPGSSLLGVHVKASLVKAAYLEKAYQKALLLLTPPARQVWKSYYFQGATRLAMRVQVNGVTDKVYYLLTDHASTSSAQVLGSTTVSYRSDGLETRMQSYKPWGEFRDSGNSLPTDRTFTGQRWDSYINLHWYGSRWYDAYHKRLVESRIKILVILSL